MILFLWTYFHHFKGNCFFLIIYMVKGKNKMNDEVLKDIQKILPELLRKKTRYESNSCDWYASRLAFLKKNLEVLTDLSKVLVAKYGQEYEVSELIYMQKLFLMYPNYIPKKLLSLSWEHIKIILDLCTEEKRKFYLDLTALKNLTTNELKKHICQDFYEKTIVIMTEVANYDEVTKPDFLIKAEKVSQFVWKNN